MADTSDMYAIHKIFRDAVADAPDHVARAGGSADPDATARQSLKRLAARHQAMQVEIDHIDLQLEEMVRAADPALLSLFGDSTVIRTRLAGPLENTRAGNGRYRVVVGCRGGAHGQP